MLLFGLLLIVQGFGMWIFFFFFVGYLELTFLMSLTLISSNKLWWPGDNPFPHGRCRSWRFPWM